jgi:hypothetical protein
MSTLSTAASWYRGSYSNVYIGGVGYDAAPCVARFAFTTDSRGAASLSFRTSRMAPDYNYGHDQPDTLGNFRWTVTAEAQGMERACGFGGWPCAAVRNGVMSGSHSLSLLPQTTYYLWIFPQNSDYCLWWIDGATVETEGEYGLPSEVEAADGCFGEPLPIRLSRSLSDATHTVTVDCAGVRSLLMERGSQYPSLNWETRLADYAPLLPNAASAQAVIRVETFCGGRSLGSVSKTVEMRIPQGALEPTLSPGWAALRPCNTGDAAGFTCLIAGHSRLEAVFDPTKIDTAPLLGASITGYELELPGETVAAAPYVTGLLTEPVTAWAWAVDSRGQRHGCAFPVTPLAYGPPVLTGLAVYRCRADGTADENGTAIAFSAGVEYSPLAGENSVTLTAALRPPGGSFGQEAVMSPGTALILTGQDPDHSVECRVRAVDALGKESAALRRLPTRRWAMKFRPDGEGVAFGKAPERSKALELPGDWEIRVGQGSLWLALHPVGSLTLSDAAPAEGVWADQGSVLGTHLWKRTT